MPNFQIAFNSPDFKQVLTTYVAAAGSGKARVLACSVHVPDRHNQNKYLLSLKKKTAQKDTGKETGVLAGGPGRCLGL